MHKVLHKSKNVMLTERQRRGNGNGGNKRRYYEIEIYTWWHPVEVNRKMMEQARDIYDPFRNKSGHDGRKWRFRSRDTAEQCYTALVLMF